MATAPAPRRPKGDSLFLAPIGWLRRELGLIPYPHAQPGLILDQLKQHAGWAHLHPLEEADLSHESITFPRPIDIQSKDLTRPFADTPAINRLHLAGLGNYPPFGVKIFHDVVFAHKGDRFCVLRGRQVDAHSTSLPGAEMARRMAAGQVEHVSEMAYTGDRHSPNNPAHYIADQLPRALMLRDDMGIKRSDIYLPITSAPVNAELRKTLDHAFRQAHTGRVYHVDRLVLCNDAITNGTHGAPFHYCDRALMAEIAEAALRLAATGRSQGAKIYMSRAGNKRRALTNEAGLERALAAQGFVSVDMGALSGADQLATISQADVIVAPHGGALTTIFAAKPGASCIELFNPQKGTMHFAMIADRVGLRYKAIMGTPEGIGGDAADGAWQIDIASVMDAVR